MKIPSPETTPDAARVESRTRRGVLFLAIGFLLADFLVLNLPFQTWAHLPSRWNWFGKIASLAFSCLVLAGSPWLRQNVGLRWHQSPGSLKLSLGCFLGCLAIGIGFGFSAAPMAFSRQTLLFQFFLPGMDEELAVRGIALAIFERAFGQSPLSCRLRYGRAALITSLAFGLAHSASFDGGHFQFFYFPFLLTTAFASAMALVRTRSGSLLWPVLCHGAWDGLLYLVPMLR
jgi:hypothetical protein